MRWTVSRRQSDRRLSSAVVTPLRSVSTYTTRWSGSSTIFGIIEMFEGMVLL